MSLMNMNLYPHRFRNERNKVQKFHNARNVCSLLNIPSIEIKTEFPNEQM